MVYEAIKIATRRTCDADQCKLLGTVDCGPLCIVLNTLYWNSNNQSIDNGQLPVSIGQGDMALMQFKLLNLDRSLSIVFVKYDSRL